MTIDMNYFTSNQSEKMRYRATENFNRNEWNIRYHIRTYKAQPDVELVAAGCETMPDFDMKDFIGPVKALILIISFNKFRSMYSQPSSSESF